MTGTGGPRPAGARTALAAAFVLALALRLLLWSNPRGGLWFEEDVPLAWAWSLWGFERGRFDPNPHNALWPHLSVYACWLVQALQYAAGRARGALASLADFRAAAMLDPGFLRGGAMLAAIGIGMGTLAAAARLAFRVAGTWAAVAVTLVLAVDPLFLRYSLAISPDMLLTACTILGLLAALDVAGRGRWRDSLAGGLWLGLGTACKYSPVLLAVPLLIAHARRPGGRRGVRVLVDVRLWAAAGVALAAFAAGSPFTLVDLASRWSQLRLGASVLVHAPAGAVRHWAAGEFLLRTLPGDLGWPLYALLAIATLGALVRGGVRARVLAAFALVVLAVFGLVPTAFERYLMPAYAPVLALGAMAARRGFAQMRFRGATALALATALAGLVPPAAAFVRGRLLPDSRALAGEWCAAHLPDRATVLLEYLGPELADRAARTRLARARALSPRWRERLERGPAWYVSPQPLSFPAPEVSTPFYVPTRCTGFDFVVTSGGVSGRYLAEPARFPVQRDFYTALGIFGERVYRTPDSACTGPPIEVVRTPAAIEAGVAAWWAARERLRAANSSRPLDGFAASQFAQRAMVLSAGGRWPAALASWRLALAWPHAPAAWRRGFATCAQRDSASR